MGPFGVFGSIGSLGLIVAAIAAGVALYRHAGAPVSVAVLLAISGFLITAHPPPYGPIGLVLFIAAVLLYVRSQSGARAPAPLDRPDRRNEDLASATGVYASVSPGVRNTNRCGRDTGVCQH